MVADPRFEGQRDMPAVKKGDWYALENVGYISGGQSTSDFVTSYVNGVKFLDFYFQSSYNGGGDARGMYMRLRLSGAGTGGGEAIRAYTEINAALTTGGVHGLHASVAHTADGSESGLSVGVRATLDFAAATRTPAGTHASLQCDSVIGTGNTVDGQRIAFIRFADGGNVKMPYLFNFDGLVAGDSAAAIQADSGAVGSIYGYARVICPDGSVGYICIYAAHS